MGFFFSNKEQGKHKATKKFQTDMASEYGCAVCPLDKDPHGMRTHPKMEPTGSSNPVVYVLGDSPTQNDDLAGEQFSRDNYDNSKVRDIIDGIIGSREAEKNVRWNNTVRCNLLTSNPIDSFEVSCCKSSLIKDIEETKPTLILGISTAPLLALTPGKMLSLWRGRIFPIKIGTHKCYCAPIMYAPVSAFAKYESEDERMFREDILHAFNFLKTCEEPIVIDSGYTDGVEYVLGSKVGDLDTINNWFDYFRTGNRQIAIDIESSSEEKLREKSVRPYGKGNKIVSVAISDGEKSFAFPINHPKAWNLEGYDKNHLLGTLMISLRHFILTSGSKIAHNLKMELEWFAFFLGEEILWETKWDDTQVQAYLLDERSRKEEGMLNLNRCTYLELGFELKPLSNIDASKILQHSLVDILTYNALDAKYEYILWQVQRKRLPLSQYDAYDHVIGVTKSTIMAQIHGVQVDEETLFKFDYEFKKILKDTLKSINQESDIKKFVYKYGEFNPESPDHVKILYIDMLEMEVLKETKGGKTGANKKPSVDKTVLEIYAKKKRSAALILVYREYTTLLGTFIEGTKNCMFPDGRLHTNYNVTFTSTGRLSSDFPNLQNFPKRGHKEVRTVVIADKGKIFLAFDYAQLEARVLAMISQDPAFCQALWDDLDIHMAWAERLVEEWPTIIEELDNPGTRTIKQFRSYVKNKWVFALLYGAGYNSVAASFKRKAEHIRHLVDGELKEQYPRVFEWQEEMIALYKKQNFIESYLGRRRYAPLSKNEIINLPIQSISTDIVTMAGRRFSKYAYETKQPEYQWKLNIHDDLTFLVTEENLDEKILFIAKEMVRPLFDFIIVPLGVEFSLGDSWGALEDIGKYYTNDFFDYQGDGKWIEK